MVNHRDHFDNVVNHLTNTEKGYVAEMRRDIGTLHVDRNGIPVTTSLLLLNTILGNNTLLEGDSGTGKTHLSSVVGTITHQIPYTLFHVRPVNGTPGVSANEVYANADIAALQRGEDQGFLYLPFHFPILFIDEINRFTPQGQNMIRGGISSDVWSFANYAWHVPQQTVIAAINPEAHSGTHPLNENLLDNFGIMLPPARTNPLIHDEMIVSARSRVRNDLSISAQDLESFIQFYKENKNDQQVIAERIHEMQEQMHQQMKDRGIPHIYNGDMAAIREEVMSIGWEDDAKFLKYCALAEINNNSKYGDKRCDDPISDEPHDRGRAGANLIAPLHGRFLADWESTANAVAWLRRHNTVKVEDVIASFTYASAGRIFPTKEYFQEVRSTQRTMPVRLAIPAKLMENIHERFQGINDNVSTSCIRNAAMSISRMDIEQGDPDYVSPAEIQSSVEKIRTLSDHPIAAMLAEYYDYTRED